MKFFGKIDVNISDSNKGVLNIEVKEEDRSLKLKYPCKSSDCTPYKIVLDRSRYLFELYGASGGYLNSEPEKGGHGAYTRGILDVARMLSTFAYIGQQGKIGFDITYNGGGKGSQYPSQNYYGGSGGGATDLRLTNGEWSDLNSLKSRIMVSGGGAGSVYYWGLAKGGKSNINGSDGSYSDYDSNHAGQSLINAKGGTQTFGGSGCKTYNSNDQNGENGKFGSGGSSPNTYYASGGGGGYYGGGSGCVIQHRVASGAGGSSFVSGHPECNAVAKEYSINNQLHSNQPVHYSNIKFMQPFIREEQDYYGDGKVIITIVLPYHISGLQNPRYSYIFYFLFELIFITT